MKTLTLTVELTPEEAEAAAGDTYARPDSIFTINRVRAKVADAARVALAIERVEQAHADYAQAQEAKR